MTKILVDKSVIELALNALKGGLWDYGPGQDEHDKCNEVIAALEDTLAQSADGMPVIKHCDVCGSDYWDGSRHPYPIYVANETIPEGFRTMEVRMKELQETKGEQIEAARQRLKDKINCVPSEDPDELLLQYKLRIKELESELDAHKAIANAFANAEHNPIGYIDGGDLRELWNGNERQYSLFTKNKGRMVAIYTIPIESVKQNPVGYVYERLIEPFGYRKDVHLTKNVPIGTDLYAAPVRTKDLTNSEKLYILGSHIDPITKDVMGLSLIDAAIAADREKNK